MKLILELFAKYGASSNAKIYSCDLKNKIPLGPPAVDHHEHNPKYFMVGEAPTTPTHTFVSGLQIVPYGYMELSIPPNLTTTIDLSDRAHVGYSRCGPAFVFNRYCCLSSCCLLFLISKFLIGLDHL